MGVTYTAAPYDAGGPTTANAMRTTPVTRPPLMLLVPLWAVALVPGQSAQKPPYDVFPPADPPYYRVRYEASADPGGLAYPVNYTIWVPPGVKAVRGVIVHQHGCGEGS